MHRRVEDGSGSGSGDGERKKKKMEEVMTRSHRCQLWLLRYPNHPKEDGDDNNDDNGVSHQRSETEGRQLLIIDKRMIVCDHKKCIESQQRSGMNSFDLDLVLPGHKHGHGHDSVCTAEHQESKQAEADPDSLCNLELMEVPDLYSTDQTFRPCSPSNSDSSISTPFAWKDADEDFKLADEDS